MSKTMTSNSVVFMDTTDNRKLDVYITSNLPQIQIRNANTNAYTPDWTSTPLILEADAYLDSQDVTDNATFAWYTKDTAGIETLISNAQTTTINTNDLDANQLVVYVCKATYKASDADSGINALAQITFSQVTTGVDGTSISIKSTAYYNGTISSDMVGQFITLYKDEDLTTLLDTSDLEEGDSYVVQGYLCAYAPVDDAFVCVGTIQGLKGEDGKDGVGTPGADAVTFQVYSSNGYVLSNNTPTITLQTFAYIGDVEITADATYQWYLYNDEEWTEITSGTQGYLALSRDDVSFSRSYMCKMTFNSVEYASVVTIDDKSDENKVFTAKPSGYSAGDLWIVGVDYAPTGVEVGTLLRAEHTNISYSDDDWITATKYDEKIDELKSNLETYNQYFSFDSTDGLRISARDTNGAVSKFSTSLTNTQLAFNYGNEAVAYIDGTKMTIKEAEIESPLTVTGKYSGSTMLQAPVINIGNFSIIVESNGSLSIIANT